MNFTTLMAQPTDPILSLIDAFKADGRAEKIDLGIGVYRDEHGATPVMRAVKEAEDYLLSQQASKSYLGVDGDSSFLAAIQTLILGRAPVRHATASLQTVGGTGALKLAAELLVREAQPRTVWVATPTWPNHDPIFRGTGLRVRTFRHDDVSGQAFDPEALEAALDEAEAGDVLVLHGCCHNPTGIDPDVDQWSRIGSLLARRKLFPIIDMAYHGLGGGLCEDRAGMLALMQQVPAGLIAYSCSKNFALYRDRVGALVVFGDKLGVELARSNLIAIARASYSMPPDHGASVVSLILQSAHLTDLWRRELDAMRLRVRQLREALATLGTAGGVDLAPLARQKGFFSVLPLSTDAIVQLRERFGIYMAPSGRVNIAGLRLEQVETLVDGLRAVA